METIETKGNYVLGNYLLTPSCQDPKTVTGYYSFPAFRFFLFDVETK